LTINHRKLYKNDLSSVAEIGKPYKIFLENLTERENPGVLVVDEISVLKHCGETGHNDVIFVNNRSF